MQSLISSNCFISVMNMVLSSIIITSSDVVLCPPTECPTCLNVCLAKPHCSTVMRVKADAVRRFYIFKNNLKTHGLVFFLDLSEQRSEIGKHDHVAVSSCTRYFTSLSYQI